MIGITAVLVCLRVAGLFPQIQLTEDGGALQWIFVGAGVGGLLSVLAIVISLTLMGVQYASQEYTHRVMNTYIKSVMLWAMIGTYISTVLYDLYIIAIIKTPIDPVFTDISLLLQSLCLIMLIPHFIIAVMYFKPDMTIGRILRSINKEYFSSIQSMLISGKGRIDSKVDRLLPAVEIIEKSMQRGDRETVRTALNEMHMRYEESVEGTNEEWTTRFFLNQYLRLGREAIIEEDDDSAVQIISFFGDIGASGTNHDLSRTVIEYIDIIGMSAVKRDLDAVTEQMIDSLMNIAQTNIEEPIAGRIFDTISELTIQLFKLEKKGQIKFLISRMSVMAEAMITRKNVSMIKNWAMVTEQIGKRAVNNKMRDVIHECIEVFYRIGTMSAREGIDAVNSIIEPLLRMEQELGTRDRDLVSEIEYAKKEVEETARKHMVNGKGDTGINTSDLW